MKAFEMERDEGSGQLNSNLKEVQAHWWWNERRERLIGEGINRILK